jgi:periplasmic protein TonB
MELFSNQERINTSQNAIATLSHLLWGRMTAARTTSIVATITVHVLIALALLVTVPVKQLAFDDGPSLATFDVTAHLPQPAQLPRAQPEKPTSPREQQAVAHIKQPVPVTIVAANWPAQPQLARPAVEGLSAPPVPSHAPLRSASLTQSERSGNLLAAPSAMRRDAGEAGTTDYAGRVVAWLEHRKAFPSGLRRERGDFTVVVRFRIDDRGRATDIMLAATSGKHWLDLIALDQVRDASPFPRPPKDLDASARSFEVPLRYRVHG